MRPSTTTPEAVETSDVFPFSWPLIAGPLMVALPNVLLGVRGGDEIPAVRRWMSAGAVSQKAPKN